MRMKRTVAALLMAGGSAFALSLSAGAEPAKELHVMHAGGQWGDAVHTCVDEPLMEKKHGIKVVVESPGGLQKLQAMVESGNITNTSSDMETSELVRAREAGLIEKIDWSKIKTQPIFDEAKNEYGFGSSYYSTIMAWRSDAKAPKDWVEFFDTKNFPGKRALPDYPGFVLTFAALGDGVPVDKLFPLDLDRAFKTLERIKADTIWWQAGAQPPQLLKDNEAQYAISWSGRVVGQPGVEVSFNQGMLDISWFIIAKGSKPEQVEAAYLWFAEQTDPEAQGCIMKYVSYPGPTPGIEKYAPPEKLKELPTYGPNKDVQWLQNGEWWVEHADEVEKRWNEFKLAQ
jgi:putative spermidine/putrescine transport system substrate-binding protein